MGNDEKAPARTITGYAAEIAGVRESSPKGRLQLVSTGDYVSVQTLAPIAHRGRAGRITKTDAFGSAPVGTKSSFGTSTDTWQSCFDGRIRRWIGKQTTGRGPDTAPGATAVQTA
jgi:hypothetical protein